MAASTDGCAKLNGLRMRFMASAIGAGALAQPTRAAASPYILEKVRVMIVLGVAATSSMPAS